MHHAKTRRTEENRRRRGRQSQEVSDIAPLSGPDAPPTPPAGPSGGIRLLEGALSATLAHCMRLNLGNQHTSSELPNATPKVFVIDSVGHIQ